MADYDGMILTKTGMQLQAQAQLGGELRITKIAIGDGMLESGDSIEDLTGLKNQVMALSIQDMEVTDDGQSRIRALITNDNLTTGFFVREVGVFAKIGDTGTERLYSYTNAGDKADYMPSQGVNVVEEVLEVYIIVGNAQNVTCIIDDRLTLATKLDIEKHDADQTAHADLLHLWQPNRAYAVGDIAYHPNLPSWAYLECITAGTSGATEPTWSAVGEEINDGTVTWRVRDIKSGSGIQIGTIMPFLALSPPAGWLTCDTGALVSRATYAELWAWVQSNAPLTTEAEWQTMAAAQTSVGYYSSGDGSTTFRLPRLVDFVRGSDSANGRDVGSWQDSQNKEHTHNVQNIGTSVTTSAGGLNLLRAVTGTNPEGAIISNGMSTNGGTETRPKNIAMLYCVKAFDAVVNEGLIDVTELANEVAGKQDRVLYGLIVDEKPSGTHGGTFTAGAWRTRDLNTIKHNDNDFVTLSDNQITLSAGTYRVNARCPGLDVSYHQAKLYNITDGIDVLGSSENVTAASNNDAVGVCSIVLGQFIISKVTAFELRHRSVETFANQGFGTATGIGTSEIYSIIEIWKVG